MNKTDLLDFTRFDAILFDLDGVITKTAVLHAAAWKRLFDGYLQELASRTGSQFVPFDLIKDYRAYVDGKPRYDGVQSFLASRGLTLPWGTLADTPDKQTIYGLGNRKDGYFEAQLREAGVVVYPSTVQCLRLAKARGLKTAVVSSSHHCREVIATAGLTALFDTMIDGHDIDRLHLPGKPAPDTFLEAARRLAVPPEKGVVIEDAQAGVQAGRAGGFGLVIGLNRQNQADALRRHGADLVVDDLAELLPADPEAEPASAPPGAENVLSWQRRAGR
jgi:trehalose 6-phosphate phosphatase